MGNVGITFWQETKSNCGQNRNQFWWFCSSSFSYYSGTERNMNGGTKFNSILNWIHPLLVETHTRSPPWTSVLRNQCWGQRTCLRCTWRSLSSIKNYNLHVSLRQTILKSSCSSGRRDGRHWKMSHALTFTDDVTGCCLVPLEPFGRLRSSLSPRMTLI